MDVVYKEGIVAFISLFESVHLYIISIDCIYRCDMYKICICVHVLISMYKKLYLCLRKYSVRKYLFLV